MYPGRINLQRKCLCLASLTRQAAWVINMRPLLPIVYQGGIGKLSCPATEILTSSRAFSGDLSSRAIPPVGSRITPDTPTPSRLATRARPYSSNNPHANARIERPDKVGYQSGAQEAAGSRVAEGPEDCEEQQERPVDLYGYAEKAT